MYKVFYFLTPDFVPAVTLQVYLPMKAILRFPALLLLIVTFGVRAQQPAPARNMVIFLMDGYRWRELFQGADSGVLFNNKYNHDDSVWTVTKYWGSSPEERRRKLMPFVWGTIAKQGLLLGNRNLGSLVNVQNKYWFSYPG